MPAIPVTTPNSLLSVAGSWRVIATVMRKVKIGEVEHRHYQLALRRYFG
jgi:hypothetical protein